MKDVKVKLTKFVTVNLPMLPNFIVHDDGRTRETVPVRMFTDSEIKKIGKAWTTALLNHAHRQQKAQT